VPAHANAIPAAAPALRLAGAAGAGCCNAEDTDDAGLDDGARDGVELGFAVLANDDVGEAVFSTQKSSASRFSTQPAHGSCSDVGKEYTE